MTTPEQLALLLANKEAERFFKDLKYVVLDELHSLVTSKRGHLLSLGLARLRRHAPDLRSIGLSATVSDPLDLQRWLVPQSGLGVKCRKGKSHMHRRARACPRRGGPRYLDHDDRGSHPMVGPCGDLRHPCRL